jgi:hydrogenase expression/formation protein HypC
MVAMCLAVPYRLVEVTGPGRAIAEGPDGLRDISTLLLEAPAVGAYVLVAYGSAIREVTPQEAAELLEVLRAVQEEEEVPPPW